MNLSASNSIFPFSSQGVIIHKPLVVQSFEGTVGTEHNVGELTLELKRNSLLHVLANGSAQQSNFYYMIIDILRSDDIKPIIPEQQIFMNEGEFETHRWRSFNAQQLFKIEKDCNVTLTLRLIARDLKERAKANILNLTIVATEYLHKRTF